MWRHWILIMVLVGLVACGDREGATLPPVTYEPHLPAEMVTDSVRVPRDLMDSGHGLLFVQDHALYAFFFGSRRIQLVQLDIDPESLRVFAAAGAAFYNVSTDDRLYYLNLTSLEALPLLAAPVGAWWADSPSPDGAWIVLRVDETSYLADAATGDRVLLLEEPFDRSRWLSARYVLLESDTPDGAVQYHLFAMTGGNRATLAVTSTDPAAIEAVLDSDGRSLERSPWTYVVAPPPGVTDGAVIAPCATWDIVAMTPYHQPTGFLSLDDTFEIADLVLRGEGDLLFTQSILPDCNRYALPDVAVMGWRDGALQTVATGVFAPLFLGRDWSRYGAGPTPVSGRMALSPDGAYVAWIGGSVAEGRATISLTDLRDETLATTPVIEVQNDGSYRTDRFATRFMIQRVAWLWAPPAE